MNTMCDKGIFMKCAMLCLALVLLVLPASVHTAAAATEDVAIAYQLMEATGLIEGAIPSGQTLVTRADLIRVAVGLKSLPPEALASANIPYTDVARDNPMYATVSTAYYHGLIPFATSSVVGLDTPVSQTEAAAALVSALGYGSLASAKGGYPAGYLAQANSLGLMPAGDDSITWDTFAAAVEEALHTPPMLLREIAGQVTYREAEQPLLTYQFHLRRIDGVLRTDAFTDLYYPDSGLPLGYVRIGDMPLADGGFDTDAFLGCRVEGYYRDDTAASGENTLVCLAYHPYNEMVTLGYGELTGADTAAIRYAKDGGRVRTLSLADSAVMVYNGKHMAFDAALLTPEHGEVDVIDNDADGRYDVVRVTDYRVVVAQSITAETNTVTDLLGGPSLVLGDRDADRGVRIWKGGAEVSIGVLSVGDVLLVADSRGDGYAKRTVRASEQKVSGTITAVSEKDAEINGEESYRVAQAMRERLRAGADATFYLDEYGTVAYIALGQSRVYGYLNAMREQVLGKIEARIYTQNGRWVTLPFADNIRFNGEALSAAEAYTRLGGRDASAYRQLITYRVSTNREINQINTAQTFERWSEAEQTAIDNDIFRRNISGTYTFRTNGYTFEGILGIHAGTVFFVVPSQAPNDIDEDGFSMTAMGKLDEVSYTIEAYDCDALYQPAVCVIKGNITEPNNVYGPSNVMLVDRIHEAINPAGDAAYAIRGLFKGKEMSVYTQSKELVDNLAGGLKRGDVIQFVFDADGCITSIDRKFRAGDAPTRGASAGLYTVSTFVTGEIMGVDSSRARISVRYADNAAYVMDTATRLTNVYVYESAYDKIRPGSLSELAKGDYIFTGARYSQITEIVVVK